MQACPPKDIITDFSAKPLRSVNQRPHWQRRFKAIVPLAFIDVTKSTTLWSVVTSMESSFSKKPSTRRASEDKMAYMTMYLDMGIHL